MLNFVLCCLCKRLDYLSYNKGVSMTDYIYKTHEKFEIKLNRSFVSQAKHESIGGEECNYDERCQFKTICAGSDWVPINIDFERPEVENLESIVLFVLDTNDLNSIIEGIAVDIRPGAQINPVKFRQDIKAAIENALRDVMLPENIEVKLIEK